MLAQMLLYWWRFALMVDATILSYTVAIAIVACGVLLGTHFLYFKSLGH